MFLGHMRIFLSWIHVKTMAVIIMIQYMSITDAKIVAMSVLHSIRIYCSETLFGSNYMN